MKWFKKILKGILLLLITLLIVGVAYEQISRINAEGNLPAHGDFVDVGGHKLHYYKQGTGGPTVVFESAFDPAGHLQWFNIQNKISSFATSISYDRAGLMWSERGNNPKTGKFIAKELHTLLEKSGAAKPYILVGHSLGGTLVRSYVAQYPQDVAGVLLIDSTHPRMQDFLPAEIYKMLIAGMPGSLLKFANEVGLLRQMFKNRYPAQPEYDYLNTLMPALLFKSADAILEEQDQLPAILQETSKIDSFGDIPLIVMSATDRDRYDSMSSDTKFKNELIDAEVKMQKDLLGLSSNSEQILVANSGHYINEDQPDAIINALKIMIAKTQ